MKFKNKWQPWNLSEIKTPKNAPKVFSTFSCGGGSTMGYKLAGFEVVGCCEIDQKMFEIYVKNHNPIIKHNCSLQEFNQIDSKKLNPILFDLDILDGSPPCSVFSMAGLREKKWGSEYKFREGQAVQRLDDLFFVFIETAKKLKPKIVVSENVKGMLLGNAKGYVHQVIKKFRQAGYETQVYLLNASKMNVPQARERVFFLSRRIDLNIPRIELKFDMPIVTVSKAFEGINDLGRPISEETKIKKYWHRVSPGMYFNKKHPKGHLFNYFKLHPNRPAPTVTGSSSGMITHWDSPRFLSNIEFSRLQTFPDDFNYLDQKAGYVCGMSVPPFMMKALAEQIQKQWLTKIPK